MVNKWPVCGGIYRGILSTQDSKCRSSDDMYAIVYTLPVYYVHIEVAFTRTSLSIMFPRTAVKYSAGLRTTVLNTLQCCIVMGCVSNQKLFT